MAHNHSRHMLIMLVCCLAPLAAFAALTIFRIPVSTLLTIGLVLLCPLGHFLMMRGMMGEHEKQQPGAPIDGAQRSVPHH